MMLMSAEDMAKKCDVCTACTMKRPRVVEVPAGSVTVAEPELDTSEATGAVLYHVMPLSVDR